MKRIKVKPGRRQSMVGFFAGIVFCLIGLFVAIPGAGLFGVFWTLLAVVITVSNGMNAFSDKGPSSHEIIIDDHEMDLPRGRDAAHERKAEIEERLNAAEELYQSGMITSEEYQDKRKEILKEL